MEEENKTRKPYIKSKTYHALTMRLIRLKKKIGDLKNSHLNFTSERREYRKAMKLRKRLKSLHPNPAFTKIQYIRYADD